MIIIGDSSVGKTSILMRLVRNQFDDQCMTTLGAGFKTKEITYYDHHSERMSMKLSIWDTAGQEKFDSLTKMYFNNTEAALIVYDVTSELSFEKVKKWVTDLNDHEVSSKTKIAKFIVGNKIDCNNIEVLAKQGLEYASTIGAEFHEVSAKNDTNITPMFQDVCL